MVWVAMIAGFRVFLLLLSVGLLVLGLLGVSLSHAQGPSQGPTGMVIKVDGVINGVKTRYIARAILEAQESGHTLLVIEIDTPGGFLDSTRDIVELLLESPLPVAVYVSPRGARAGSAGTFITAAGHFAAMAPGTNIGAATPVSGTREDLEDTLASKVENDAAALIRSIAQERGRNEEALEQTVREAASFSAREALELNVVDLISEDLDDLLLALDGREYQIAAEDRVKSIETQGMELDRLEKNLLEFFLEFISDPNVSFILLMLGALGISIELFNPGLIAPGVVGAICMLLAFLALGNLPVNWAAAAFVILAVLLVVLETQVAGFGMLGVGAMISLVLGGLLLFTQFGDVSPTLPKIGVSRWVLLGAAGALAMGVYYVAREVYSSRRQGREPSRPSPVGSAGVVTGAVDPTGVVRIGGETWTAVSEDGTVIDVGEPVTVMRIDGLILTISRKESVSN